MRWTKRLFLCLPLLVIADSASAQNLAQLNNVVQTFQQQTANWSGLINVYAMETFGILAVIDLAMATIRVALGKPDWSDFLSMLVNELLFLGLFAWLMQTNTWATAIINTFRQLAGVAGGPRTLTPGDIAADGVDLGGKILSAISVVHPSTGVAIALGGTLVVICFGYIAAAMIIALVESYFITASSTIFMAFGGSRWTKDIAIGVLRHIFGLGVRLFALQVIASAAARMANDWVNFYNPSSTDAQPFCLIVIQSIVLLAVAWEVPKSMERMVSGTSTTHAGGIITAGAAAVGAAASVASGSLALASGVAGTSMALREAGKLAAEQMAERGSTAKGLNYAARLTGNTIKNTASAAANDIGRRISGQTPGYGQMPWRMNSNLAARRQMLADDANQPPPPPPPNSIGGTP
jgi:type IV secretion system protein TrbL